MSPSRSSHLILIPAILTIPFLLWPGPAFSQGEPVSITIPVRAGWNMLSLPLTAEPNRKDSVFPTAVSNAIRFRYGWQVVDTIVPGGGLWMKFPENGTITVVGQGYYHDTITLVRGWNLVGSLSTPLAAERIMTVPPGIISSPWVEYVPGTGYRNTGTLKPGGAYWVKSSKPGSMILMAMDAPCPGTSDIEYAGRVYTTVQIGDLCWLKQNLDVGEMIQGTGEQTDNGLIEKYCYADNQWFCLWYGAFYQWDEAMQYPATGDLRGICPSGWHIPSRDELLGLVQTVDGNGNALKREYQGLEDGVGTNESGFSALLSGYRQRDGYFSLLKYGGYLWSSSEIDGGTAHSLYLFGTISDVYFNDNTKDYGFSVRCVKD